MRTTRISPMLLLNSACALAITGAPMLVSTAAPNGTPVEKRTSETATVLRDSSNVVEEKVCVSDLESITVIATASARFAHLAKLWREKIRYSSSLRYHIMQPEYWDIIKMDKAALPYIFAEMTGPRWADWLFALRVITSDIQNAPQIAPEAKLNDIRSAWLQWSRDNNYLAA